MTLVTIVLARTVKRESHHSTMYAEAGRQCLFLFLACLLATSSIAQDNDLASDVVGIPAGRMNGYFSADGRFVPPPAAEIDEFIALYSELSDVLLARAEFAIRNGDVSGVTEAMLLLSETPGFDINQGYAGQSLRMPNEADSTELNRELLLVYILPYVYPSVRGQLLTCSTMNLGASDASGDSAINETTTCSNGPPRSIGVADLFTGSNQPREISIEFYRRGSGEESATGLGIRTGVDIHLPGLSLLYPDGDSLFVVRDTPGAFSFLDVAARGGSIPVLDILLNAGADPNVAVSRRQTALHHAVLGRSPAAVTRLLNVGASANVVDDDGLSPLHQAVRLSDSQTVLPLTAGGANLDQLFPDSRTPLLEAIHRGNIDIASILIEAGADPSIPDSDGLSPLMAASNSIQWGVEMGQREDIIRKILGKADVNQMDADGRTALHHATMSHDSATASQLISGGAAVDAKTRDGKTPLMIGAGFGNTELLDLLSSAGADIHAIDARANTALMFAAKFDARDVLVALLELGASKRSKNMDGQNARAIAKANGSRRSSAVFEHIQTIQISYLKMGANLAKLVDPQHASSVGGEIGVAISFPLLSRIRVQADIGTVVRVTDPIDESGPVVLGGGDRYYFMNTIEARPLLRYDLGSRFRRHPYVLAGVGFGAVSVVELRDYTGQFDEEVVTDDSDETLTSINVGLGWQGATARSVYTFEFTYSRVPSMQLDRFEGALTTFGFSIGVGL